MEETGGSLNNLVKTNVFLKDLKDLTHYREVERLFFADHAAELTDVPPASTAMIVKELPRTDFLVEVEAYGVVDKSAPDWTTVYHPGNKNAASSVSTGNLLFLSACDGSNPNTGKVESDAVEDQIITALIKLGWPWKKLEVQWIIS